MRQFVILTCLLGLSVATRDRTCCKYSCGQEGDQCPVWCDSSSGCVLRDRSGLLEADRSAGQCSVSRDSKKNKTDDSISQCLSHLYTSDQRLVDSATDNILPFSVVAYPFKGTHQLDSHFTGIDVRYQYGAFQRLQFRLKNTNSKVCPSQGVEDVAMTEQSDMAVFGQQGDVFFGQQEISPTCHPRCVEINVNDPDIEPVPGDYYGEDS